MGNRYFFDLPVYRLSEKLYYRDRDTFIEKGLYSGNEITRSNLRKMYEDNSNMEDAARVRLAESYGGEWRFNEIIGYIRLYFLGDQVRGEHHGVYKKRIVRTRTKKFEFIHWKLADEVEIPNPITDEGIFRAVLEYVDDCRKELPRRHIDTTSLLVLGKHLSWRELFFSK